MRSDRMAPNSKERNGVAEGREEEGVGGAGEVAMVVVDSRSRQLEVGRNKECGDSNSGLENKVVEG